MTELWTDVELDQQRRYANGDAILVEAYLVDHPELASNPRAMVRLLLNEWQLRRQRGEEPTEQEYAVRFPEYAAFLLGQIPASRQTLPFEVHGPDRGEHRFPGYQVVGVLGRGGMGTVYKAWHDQLKRWVAIKGLRGATGSERLRLEAEAIARLQHPNIVTIHDVGEVAGQPYLVLEYAEGGSLAQSLAGRRVQPDEAANLVEVLARAVDHAHQAGIIHRDLKPANILLTADGTPKITDFGLAKDLSEPRGMTASLDILGTPSYMAPEQVSKVGTRIGPRCDVYALGAILYEMLTGRPPFQAATAIETVLLVLNEEPIPPRRQSPEIPRDLETICLKCLNKLPADRYAGAGELADDLQRHVAGEPIHARSTGVLERWWKWARRRPVVASLSLACLLTLATLVGVWAERSYTIRREQQQAQAHRDEALRNYRRVRETIDRYLAEARQDTDDNTENDLLRDRRFLEVAQRQYQELLDEYPDDPDLRGERGRALARMGGIENFIGSKPKAEEYYVQAVMILERLCREEPAEITHRLELTRARDALGRLYRAIGKVTEAVATHELAVADAGEMVQIRREEFEYKLEQAKCLKNLARALRQAKNRAFASHLQQAADILEPLFEAQPSHPVIGYQLWQTVRLIGHYRLLRGKLKEAEPWLRRALVVAESCSGKNERDHILRGVVGISQRDLGNYHALNGDWDEAERFFVRSCERFEEVLRVVPSAARMRHHLAYSLEAHGKGLEAKNQQREAIKRYQRALEEAARAVRLHPTEAEYATHFKDVLLRLVYLQSAVGESAQSGLALAKDVLTNTVPISPSLIDLAAAFAKAADMFRVNSRVPLADRERIAGVYSDLCLGLLTRAEAGGVLKDEKQHRRLTTGKEFLGVCSRADFQTLRDSGATGRNEHSPD